MVSCLMDVYGGVSARFSMPSEALVLGVSRGV